MTESVLKDKRILAVDDEEDILETIEDILIDARVDCARDYESASRKLKTGRYDLAILDIMGVDGMALLEEAVRRQIPAVMLTAASGWLLTSCVAAQTRIRSGLAPTSASPPQRPARRAADPAVGN